MNSTNTQIKLYFIFIFCLVSMVTVGWSQGDLPPMDEPIVQKITSYSGVASIKQLRFEFDSGIIRDSDWGEICIDPMAFSQTTGMDSGYLNLCIVDVGSAAPMPVLKWIIQNMCVPKALVDTCALQAMDNMDATNGMEPMSMPLCAYFDLVPSERLWLGRLDTLQGVLLASRSPLPVIDDLKSLWDTFPFDTFPVEPMTENAEGDYSDQEEPNLPPTPPELLGLLGLPPNPPDPDPLPMDPFDLLFPCEVFQTASPNIQCAKNQCVPMAHANVLHYLQNRYHKPPLVWWLPHSAIPGIGQIMNAADVVAWVPVPDSSLVANIDAKTQRKEVLSSSSGKGSGRCQQIRGVFGYYGEFGGSALVKYRHQGGDAEYGEGTTCDVVGIDLGGIVSEREGQYPTWEWMWDQLQAGRGLAMSFGRYDIVGTRTSGHMVRVWGAACYNGKNYLFTLDDGNQGPNSSGLRTQQWEVEDTGQPGINGLPDGRLNMDGMSWEIEFAISAEPFPTLAIP